ncbi:MAG TPA: hypothetical protein DCY00_08070 [Actinobacteria bacterium]|nr:hypothetical protein [Actinomycetota bacterium]
MLEFFYTLFIFPIETIISVMYWLLLKIFEIHGLAIIFLSITVNLISLPLYNVAEKWQQKERDIQARLKNKLDDIKAVFKGAERHMIIKTYYRQNNYHPFYSLRNILGLAIQVPFFIAAYHLLSHMPMTAKTSSYYFINDLRLEDALLRIGEITINVLPVVMTVVNLISAFVYSGKLQKKEKNQLFIMALIFLVLLYKSPSGLVLYWTMNNVISLIKNIINSTKNPKKYFFILLTGFLSFILFYTILFRFTIFLKMADLESFVFKRKKILAINLIFGGFLAFVVIFPYIAGKINKALEYIFSGINNNKSGTAVFVLSCSLIFMLTGLIAPSLLISGSPLEFTEIISGKYYNPSFALFNSAMQAFALFVFIPSVIYILFSWKVKRYLILGSFIFSMIFLMNFFVFSGSYGVISLEFTFDNSLILKPEPYQAFLNLTGIILTTVIVIFLIYKNYYKLIINMLLIIVISLASISFYNIYKINSEFADMLAYRSSHGLEEENSSTNKIFRLSKNGKNVFVIMLDRALGGLMSEVLKHNPELAQQMPGFVWYRNTLSFNGHTLLGAPPLFGGYEYTPIETNKRDQMTLTEKHNEALLVMPRIFLEEGYNVVVTDPRNSNDNWASDLTIYEKYPGIYADDLIGKYSAEWINENIKKSDDGSVLNIESILKEYLLNFSIFRIMPNFFRSRIYDGSRWLKPDKENLPLKFINSFSVLDYLPKLSSFDSEKNTFNITTNDTVHEPRILDIYIPADFKSTLPGVKEYIPPFNDSYTLRHFYTQIGAFQKFCKWFIYLQENGVYDNTKIIIVSDHGRDIVDPFFADFSDDEAERNEYTYYHPLLLVKDFNVKEKFSISDDFMTNADVPAIATDHLGNALNPFTGKALKGDHKKDGVEIVTIHTWRQERFSKYKFKFTEKDIIRVKNNIFLKENWTRVSE